MIQFSCVHNWIPLCKLSLCNIEANVNCFFCFIVCFGCYPHIPKFNELLIAIYSSDMCSLPKKSLAGLDSTQTAGVNAIASLEEITGVLNKNGK